MVRIISWAVGLAFCGVLAIALAFTVLGVIREPAAPTAAEEFHKEPKQLALASDGPLGRFDRRQVQRGLQVYKEVCSNCHSLSRVAFRDLTQIGYSPAQAKQFAADWANKQPTFDTKSGDRADRVNLPSDHFPTVYYPGQGNPPDLSLIAKAREGGAAYVYSLLTGYRDIPAKQLKLFPDSKPPEGAYYNPYFPILNIAMPPPLTADGQVTYADGTKSTVKQMAKDVSAFLVWTAEPNLEARHTLGLAVAGFLAIFVVLAIGAYRAVWIDKKH